MAVLTPFFLTEFHLWFSFFMALMALQNLKHHWHHLHKPLFHRFHRCVFFQDFNGVTYPMQLIKMFSNCVLKKKIYFWFFCCPAKQRQLSSHLYHISTYKAPQNSVILDKCVSSLAEDEHYIYLFNVRSLHDHAIVLMTERLCCY